MDLAYSMCITSVSYLIYCFYYYENSYFQLRNLRIIPNKMKRGVVRKEYKESIAFKSWIL